MLVTAPSAFERLLNDIVAVDRLYQQAQIVFGEDSPPTKSAQQMQIRLQMALLRNFAPNWVYLSLDTISAGEAVYNLCLRHPQTLAMHRPLQLAIGALSAAEIQRFSDSQPC